MGKLEVLTRFNEKYEQVMVTDDTEYGKNCRLAALMTELERYFDIPLLDSEDYHFHSEVDQQAFTLYKKISDSRNWDELGTEIEDGLEL